MKFDTSNDTQKYLLWKQYVAWHCNGYTAATISIYINNPVLQDFLLESDYFGVKCDEKVYIDLWDSAGYTDKIEKPSKNDSKLNAKLELKNAVKKTA